METASKMLLTCGHHGVLQSDRTAAGMLFRHTEASSQCFRATAHSPLRAWGNIEQRRSKCKKPEWMYCYTPVSVEEKMINLYFTPFLFGFPNHILCSHTTAAALCFFQWQIRRQVDLAFNKIDFNFNPMKCNLI